jgi:hypothetical protein
MTPEREPNDEFTGLSGLRTWRSVYAFVLIAFAVYVALLVLLERMFS